MEYSKKNRKICIAELIEAIICVIIYTILNIFPIIHNNSLVYLIPLYAVDMFFLLVAASHRKRINAYFAVFGGMHFVGLIAIYAHYLIPRRNIMNLGTVTVFEPAISKVMFIIGGVFALITICLKFVKTYHSLKN